MSENTEFCAQKTVKMKHTNIITWLMTATLLVSCAEKKEMKEAPSIKVMTETLVKDQGCSSTMFVGQVEAESTSSASFPTAGTVLRVPVNEGQEVRRGQLLAEMDASVSGTIGQKLVRPGETVMPGQPIATIVDINSVKINVSIPEKEISAIHSDTQTVITVDALGGKEFIGGKITKNVQSDPMTHTYVVSIDVGNPSHELLPGMVCDVVFKGLNREIMTVPVSAIMRGTGDSLYLWVKKDGKAHRRTVTTGNTYGSRIEINSGINENDSVIIRGMQKLSEGSKVSAL